jgi:hypothetical protein
MRNIDDVGPDRPAANVGTQCRPIGIEDDDLHEVGFLRIIDRLGHAKRGLNPRHAIGRLGLDILADPDTVLLLDGDEIDVGAGETVHRFCGKTEDLVFAD